MGILRVKGLTAGIMKLGIIGEHPSSMVMKDIDGLTVLISV